MSNAAGISDMSFKCGRMAGGASSSMTPPDIGQLFGESLFSGLLDEKGQLPEPAEDALFNAPSQPIMTEQELSDSQNGNKDALFELAAAVNEQASPNNAAEADSKIGQQQETMAEILALLQSILDVLRQTQATAGGTVAQTASGENGFGDDLSRMIERALSAGIEERDQMASGDFESRQTGLADILSKINDMVGSKMSAQERSGDAGAWPANLLMEAKNKLQDFFAQNAWASAAAFAASDDGSGEGLRDEPVEKGVSENTTYAQENFAVMAAAAQTQSTVSKRSTDADYDPRKDLSGTKASSQAHGETLAGVSVDPKGGEEGKSFQGQSENRFVPYAFDHSLNSGLVPSTGAGQTAYVPFANALSAFRTAGGSAASTQGVVDQVLLHINRNVKNGENRMSLHLQPSDLGKVSVRLEFAQDGGVKGYVIVENPKTLEMLQKDSRSLERALQDAGLRADPGSLQFSLGEHHGGHGFSRAAYEKGDLFAQGAKDGTENASDHSDDGTGDGGIVQEAYYITSTGVNIRV